MTAIWTDIALANLGRNVNHITSQAYSSGIKGDHFVHILQSMIFMVKYH
jgi:hypothetical protein